MNILVLGGTKFVGRHIVENAIDRHHKITLFNRGQTNPFLFPEVEKINGDRDGDLAPLTGRRWDAVIDTCGYVPRIVRKSASVLGKVTDLYTFISTISVYAGFEPVGLTEEDPVGKLEDDTVEEITGETYGPLKALCEASVLDEVPGKALIIRPGLIVGPHDHTDRFTYWVRRCGQGGDILAPAAQGRPVQFIDARDLAAWILDRVESDQTGIFNATGPAAPLTFDAFLHACCEFSESQPSLIWVDEATLLDAGLEPWSQLPMWLPGSEYAGLMAVNCSRAIDAGLRFRPLRTTIADTLRWDRSRDPSVALEAGLEPSLEADLIQLHRKQIP